MIEITPMMLNRHLAAKCQFPVWYLSCSCCYTSFMIDSLLNAKEGIENEWISN